MCLILFAGVIPYLSAMVCKPKLCRHNVNFDMRTEENESKSIPELIRLWEEYNTFVIWKF